MRKVLWLFLLVLAVIAGYKLAVWYGTYRSLARVQDHFQSLGVVTWDATDSTLTGGVTLERPRIQLFDITAPIRADRLTFQQPTPWGLIKTLYGLDDQPPRHWSLKLDNFNLSLPNQLLKPWAGSDLPTLGVFNPWRLYQCGPHHYLNGAELRGMGISAISGDADLDYRIDPKDGQLHLALDVNAGAVGSLDLNLVSAPPASWSPGHWPADLPVPASAHLDIRDGGFMRRVAAYCSEANGISPAQWALQSAKAWQSDLEANGYTASTQLVALYKQWLQQGGELAVDLAPAAATGYAKLSGAGLSAAIKQLGLTVTYNDDRIPGLDLGRIQTRTSAPATAPAKQTSAAASSAPVKAPGFVAADPGEAARWLGRRVQVLYDDGKRVEGRLDAADRHSLTVTRNVDGGQASYPIDLSTVTKLLVWRTPGEALPPLPASASQAATSEPASTSGSTSASEGAPGDGN